MTTPSLLELRMQIAKGKYSKSYQLPEGTDEETFIRDMLAIHGCHVSIYNHWAVKYCPHCGR